MQVQFRTNLGRIDAQSLSLDYTKCLIGATVEVSEPAGEKLVKSGIAIDVTPPAPPEPPKPKTEPKPVGPAKSDVSK